MDTAELLNYDESMQSKSPVKSTNKDIDNKIDESYVSFTKEEWEYFFKELKLRPLTEENFQKAINNARYLAKLDRAEKSFAEGKGITMTFDELEKLIHG